MTKAQESRFVKLCMQMGGLLKELETEHPEIMFFIEDGTPYLIDPPDKDAPLKKYVIARGIFWPRSGGGGF